MSQDKKENNKKESKKIAIPAERTPSSTDLSVTKTPYIDLTQGDPQKKSTAAARIFNRLQKKSEEGSAPPELEILPEIPENKETIHEIILTEELAQIHQALQQKFLTSQQVIDIFLRKFQLEKTGQQSNFIEIAKNERYISQETSEKLSAISESKQKFTKALPKPSQWDFVLAHRLVETNLIDRKTIQIFLRILSNIYTLGLESSLSYLLITSKTLAQDILNPFVEQCRKEAQEKAQEAAESVQKIEVSTKALQSKPVRKYPVMTILGLIFIILPLFLIFKIWDDTPSQKKIYSPPQTSPTKLTPIDNSQPQIVTPDIPPTQHIKPIPTTPDPKEIIREMEGRGLAKWGEYWIPIDQEKILKQRYNPGNRPQQVLFQWIDVEIYLNSLSSQLEIQGKLDIPELPDLLSQTAKPFHIMLSFELFYGIQTIPLAQKTFPLVPNRPFEISWKPEFNLPLGTYCVKITAFPENQSPFSRFFLYLREVKIWENWFVLGHPTEISKYYETCRTDWDALADVLWQSYEKISPQTPKSKWPELLENSKIKIKYVENQLQAIKIHPFAILIPVEWKKLVVDLQNIFQIYESWQKNTETIPPNTWQAQMEWEVHFEELKAAFFIQEQKMLEILQKPGLKAIQKK